jgi:alkylation response protein AidB-like acyl-CoA dehydrogenase
VQELGRHAAPAPFTPTVLAIAALAEAGDDAWVDRLVTGDALACVAWDPGAPVPYAPSADLAVVLADDGVYALDISERPARQPAMDLTRELGWLPFDRDAARRIGDADARERLLDRGATFAAADLLGTASRALELAVEHAKDRVQFGRPIGSFQAVKHRCADMLVDVEGMRSTVYWAAWCINGRSGSPRRGVDCEDVVLRRVEAGHELGAPSARRHRVHLGARPALLHEARPARPARVRRRVGAPGAAHRAAAPARRSGGERGVSAA